MSLFDKTVLITLNNLELSNNDLFVRKTVEKPTKKTFVIVNDTHNAIFIKDGAYLNTLSAGKYPVVDKDDKDVNTVEFIYVSKTCRVEVKWGTPNKFDMRDPETDIPIKVGVRGTFEVQIGDPRKAYLELIGSDQNYNIDKLQARLRSRMCNEIQPIIARTMADQHLTYDRLAQNKKDIGDHIMPELKTMFSKDYGLTLYSFVIDDIMVDMADIQRIEAELDRRKEERRRDELKAKEDIESRDAFDEQIRREYEMINLNRAAGDIEFERRRWLENLKASNYEKYLRAVQIVGWEGNQASGGAHYCPDCGHSYENGASFCPGCGKRLSTEANCPACHSSVAPGTKFCPNCGHKIL